MISVMPITGKSGTFSTHLRSYNPFMHVDIYSEDLSSNQTGIMLYVKTSPPPPPSLSTLRDWVPRMQGPKSLPAEKSVAMQGSKSLPAEKSVAMQGSKSLPADKSVAMKGSKSLPAKISVAIKDTFQIVPWDYYTYSFFVSCLFCFVFNDENLQQ